MKNVLIISSSPRINGNSDTLCKEFMKGAIESGHNVNLINLANKKINYCIGCRTCEKSGHCFQNDDMKDILEKVLNADVIVFSTPVYFYSMSGQLKVFIDRLTPIYDKVRADTYIIATAWDSNIENLQGTANAIRGLTVGCFENCTEKGCLLVGDVVDLGDVKQKSEAMIRAYNMGKNC